jgi:predicted DNA-binding WGR domain protein
VRTERREFQFIDGSSKKFWAIELDGKAFTVHFGRIGTTGQAKEKAFVNDDAAKREYDKLILEKTRNGYVEVASGISSAGATPEPRKAPTATSAAPVGVATTADGGNATAGIEAAASPPASLAPRAPVAAHDGPLDRRVKMADEDRARVTWLPLEPAPLREPRPFSFETCLQHVKAALNDWYYISKIAGVIPDRLSKEEAWFWLNVLDTRDDERRRLEERLRSVQEDGLPDDSRVRAWAKSVSSRSYSTYVEAPQVLLPFFTLTEIADLIIEAVALDAVTRQAGWGQWAQADAASRAVLGFSARVVPQMSEKERHDFRGTMERMYDAEPDLSSPRAALIVACLSTVGGGHRLAAWVAAQPDDAWQSAAWYWRSTGHLDLLAGLDDEASFVREARRLIGRLGTPSDLWLWLAATEWRELDLARDAVLAKTAKDEAAAMARVLALVEAPEAALPMLEVQLGSKAPAIAAEWLAAHPLHAAVGLTPAAMGHGKLADAARDHLHAMRRNGLVSVLSAATAHLTQEQAAWLQNEILDVVEETLPELARAELPEALQAAFAEVKPSKPPGWLSVASLPPIKIAGKRLATAEIERYWRR